MFSHNSDKNSSEPHNKTMDPRRWLIGLIIVTGLILAVFAVSTYIIDPFYHYHAPLSNLHYERISDYERYQNDGVMRNFSYDSVIVGNSLAERFEASYFDEVFDIHAVRVTNGGGTEREFADYIRRAEKNCDDLKYVFFEVHLDKIGFSKTRRRKDITDWPDYLYNDNPLDDLSYLLNREVIFNVSYNILKKTADGETPSVSGHGEDYDDLPHPFSVRPQQDFGTLCFSEEDPISPPEKIYDFTEEDEETERGNVQYNLVDVALASPETEFYFFIPPVSIVERAEWWSEGTLEKHLEEEELAVRMLLEVPNAKVFSWNNKTDVTLDYTQYEDPLHYGVWVADQMIVDMKNGDYQLTSENVDEYFETERELYLDYDYMSLPFPEEKAED